MKLEKQTPKQSLNKAFLKQPVNRDDITLFKANLQTLLGKINENESEEHHKNFVRDFLKDTFYKADYEINTKGRQDLVIHVGKDASDKVGVILEAKKPTNKADMISADNPNKKALQELILYYLNERNEADNFELKNLVITDIYQWFIFDANLFDKQIYRNTNIKRLYQTYKTDKKDNPFFYGELQKIIANLDEMMPCAVFAIRDYETALKNDDLKDDESLIELFKILSPHHLLKVPFADDSNRLDKNFYTELLHIIGLEEIKDKSKLKIQRKDEARRDAGSLIENAIAIIETKDCLHRVKNLESYGETREERLFGVALELCLTWINRVLFLKLLEAQLVDYHNGNRDYRFLDIQTIQDFDELFTLFHQVLAKLPEERRENIKAKYARVPYLNSSLFEISELEAETVTIESLKDTIKLSFINSTVLKDSKAKQNGLPTLEYLFAFLDAYDFASEGAEGITENNRSLINASVLGKVFEKINGYKDGSIYTPGFITMYMCRQAIRLAVVQKFKDAYGWNIAEFTDIKNYLADYRSADKIKEFNALINSLHLCDPAVGSGHFLVSSLNEIIAIKCELGILADENGERFRDVEITVENDELTVFDTERSEFFKYRIMNGKPNNKEAQRLQKTLFHEKQTLIENCLFGVDINPNSVKICRLRLWIELLKNAYYKESSNFAELETLPNIDINIKEGNSLLSRFALDADLKEVLKNKKNIVADYRNAVAEYKNERNRDKKRKLLEIIDEIKGDFTTEIYKYHPKMVDLAKKERRLFEINSPSLFEKFSEGEREVLSANLEKQISGLKQEIADIKSNVIYKNAFEWRFEFPEVLDNEGNFLGFDIVVGNPPYIALQKMQKEQKAFETQKFKTYAKLSDIYCLFYEKGVQILKEKGLLTYITSNSWLRTQYGELLRKYFVENTNPIWLINIEDAQVFNEATVESNLILLAKENWTQKLQAVSLKNDFDLNTSVEDYFKENSIQISDLHLDGWIIGNESESSLKKKLEENSVRLGKYGNLIYRGFTTGLNEAFFIDTETRNNLIEEDKNCADIIKPALRGKDISKYNYQWKDIWVIIIKSGWTNANRKDEQPENFFKQNYPSIYKHFKKVGENFLGKGKGLFNRDDKGDYWWELRPCAYYADFEQEKIVWGELSDEQKFAFDDSGMFANNTIFFMTGKNLKYLLSVLNSSLSKRYFNAISTSSGMGTNRWLKYKIEQLPIKKIEEKDQQPFVALVDQILELKKEGKDTLDLENEIDTLVYQLYDLTDEEIAIVEGKN